MNVSSFLDIAEARFPHKLAVISEDKRYTFRQVKERVQRLMTGLAKLGIKKGDRVATLMWNSSETTCVGLPLPFVQVKLLDNDGDLVGIDELGEVVVRGANVMKGYYGLPEETAKVTRNGWFYSGDLARTDEEGFLYIVDRKKDMIVTGGENVSAREVEEVLFSHRAILKAAVFGLPDPKWGEKVVAAVILRTGSGATAEQVQAFLKERIAGYKVPKEVFFRDSFPESGAGKVQKNILRKAYMPIED